MSKQKKFWTPKCKMVPWILPAPAPGPLLRLKRKREKSRESQRRRLLQSKRRCVRKSLWDHSLCTTCRAKRPPSPYYWTVKSCCHFSDVIGPRSSVSAITTILHPSFLAYQNPIQHSASIVPVDLEASLAFFAIQYP